MLKFFTSERYHICLWLFVAFRIPLEMINKFSDSFGEQKQNAYDFQLQNSHEICTLEHFHVFYKCDTVSFLHKTSKQFYSNILKQSRNIGSRTASFAQFDSLWASWHPASFCQKLFKEQCTQKRNIFRKSYIFLTTQPIQVIRLSLASHEKYNQNLNFLLCKSMVWKIKSTLKLTLLRQNNKGISKLTFLQKTFTSWVFRFKKSLQNQYKMKKFYG